MSAERWTDTPVTSVSLACGCSTDVDHDHGDRLVLCGHGLEHAVRALPAAGVTYETVQRTFPPEPAEAHA